MFLKLISEVVPGEILAIGGLSRTGKTTLSNLLANNLKYRGIGCVVLSLDRWLKANGARSEGVLGRYDIPTINSILSLLVSRQCDVNIDLPYYDKLERLQVNTGEIATISVKDVVIIEGTIALHVLNQYDVKKLYLKMNENLRKSLVINEYLSRKCTLEEANAIYESRQIDETPIVIKTACIKDVIVLNAT